ncbi:MAG: helix-turn-helix domain-containing protein [candidate division WOR-3 bacterium]|nr:MAG: helix-turn-helix domain-containing protein [candidate division WOR-3 bacterium]
MKLLNISELSKKLNVKKKTIYDWIHKGSIPQIKLGRLVRFDSDEIDKWIRSKSRKSKL